MRINDAGRALLMEFEGLRLDSYLCPAGIPTIGWGHTGPETKLGQKITRHQAEEILEYDLQKFESAVRLACPKANMNQHSALVCLAFNIGVAAFRGSTLVKRFNEGGPLAAAPRFLDWTKATVKGEKVTLPGLVKRREAEKRLFLTPVVTA